jgi:outer membrane lipoprotein-sorting protein
MRDSKEGVTRLRRSPGAAVAVAVVVLIVVAGAAIGASRARAEPTPNLPAITADQLLASSISAMKAPGSISGDVRTRLDIGLPEIPASLNGAASGVGITNALGSMIGVQRFRVWSSQDGIRIQHVMDLQEQDLVANPSQAWFWDSATSTATKLRAAGLSSLPAPPTTAPDQMANADPLVLAKHLLTRASACGAVTVGAPAVVAGRDAYVLHFTPASDRTLVGDVAIAVDAQTRLPLDVSITPVGGPAPSVEAGFTSVSFDPIDPSMFDFTPPSDATVRDITGQVSDAITSAAHHEQIPSSDRPVPAGSCFDTSVAIPLREALPAQVTSLLPYSGPLWSAVETEHAGKSWLLIGPVDVATLQARAAALP